METHEFRLYNLLEHKGDLVQVVGLDLDIEDEHVPFVYVQHLNKFTRIFPNGPASREVFTIFENHQGWEEDLRPITITKEWLSKLGFEYSNLKTVKEGYYLVIDGAFLNVYDGKVDYMGRSFNHIKYVHQLQNLYFALTGKELKIM